MGTHATPPLPRSTRKGHHGRPAVCYACEQRGPIGGAEMSAELATVLGRLDQLLARAPSATAARYLSLPDAAVYTGLSVSTLRRLLAAGRLRGRRPTGGRLLPDREELAKLVSAGG